MEILLVKDIRDESGDSDFHLPAGTKLGVDSTEEGHWICDLDDSFFPVSFDEAVIIGKNDNGIHAHYAQKCDDGSLFNIFIEKVTVWYSVEVCYSTDEEEENHFDIKHDEYLREDGPGSPGWVAEQLLIAKIPDWQIIQAIRR